MTQLMLQSSIAPPFSWIYVRPCLPSSVPCEGFKSLPALESFSHVQTEPCPSDFSDCWLSYCKKRDTVTAELFLVRSKSWEAQRLGNAPQESCGTEHCSWPSTAESSLHLMLVFPVLTRSCRNLATIWYSQGDGSSCWGSGNKPPDTWDVLKPTVIPRWKPFQGHTWGQNH